MKPASTKQPGRRTSRCAPPSGSRFLSWMNHNHRGFYYGEYPCWNWKISGVLVTFWLRSDLVKIYHDEGRNTECHPAETERCREAVMGISNVKADARESASVASSALMGAGGKDK